MPLWVNRTVLSGASVAENGTTSHTCTFTPATAGNFLVAVVGGAVTFTTPVGWTLRVSKVGNTGLYVFTKTASSGESSFTTTHNGSNYAIKGIVYEYASGSSFIGTGASVGAQGSGGTVTGPQLTGLTGTYSRFAVRSWNLPSSTSTASCTWTLPTIKDYDAYTPFVSNDGSLLTIAYDDNQTATSFNPSSVLTTNSGSSGEAVTYALVVVPPPVATIPLQWIHF